MKEQLEMYQKSKKYVICIDSDGCVMDTMDRKHKECFGPCVITEWHLEEHQKEVLDIWNRINLYSRTRGIHRFEGLVALFKELDAIGIHVGDYSALSNWCKHTKILGNDALQDEFEKCKDECLKKALDWSKAVNKAIDNLSEENCVFPHAEEALRQMSQQVDVVVVSSANKEAIIEEWERLRTLPYVHMLCGQETGTKAFCIQEVKRYYKHGRVLMLGDALGDLKAAQQNDVLFYPILVGKESMSWERFLIDAFPRFLVGEYTGAYQTERVCEMKGILQ